MKLLQTVNEILNLR